MSAEAKMQDVLDTVLTLRGHRITLRQAMAEGIIGGQIDPQEGALRLTLLDAECLIQRLDRPVVRD